MVGELRRALDQRELILHYHPKAFLSDGEIRSMVSHWIFADRVRFVVGLVGLFAVLQAFRLPMETPAEVPRAGHISS